MCTLALAIDRYITVCMASDARRIMTVKVRITMCLGIIFAFITVCSASLLRITYRIVEHDEYSCLELIYGTMLTRYFVDGILFFLLPALISLLLYIRVGLTLARARGSTQTPSRNRNLTIAFIFSCCFWIICWLLTFVTMIVDVTHDKGNYHRPLRFYYAAF